ncbi:leucine-rich repeat, immunoglobulin-like domain and transmembrane domain-containing protein 2 [Paroedura picta]|uniref:leucine-rich repeat, immunoglobulin-like domain and transmembrane domain-containing protein 2 n=1 Tax=Paroedura picta TaxID=143630 RepID=UPI00405720C9
MDPPCYLFLILFLLFFHRTSPMGSPCMPGCSCANEHFGRSLFCMSASLEMIREGIPQDIKKIRIENSHLTELPRGAFSNISALEYLWLNFNNITVMHLKSLEYLKDLMELRLQGNKLSSVPWTAFQATPALNILDLKHNRLDVLPEHALRYLPNLTYLDLSSNQLTVISRDVFYNWPVYQKFQQLEKVETATNAVLALHDNPWVCDCRLRGFVQFIQSISPPLILMNSYLACLGPGLREGKYFHEVELNSCTKPVVSATESNITVAVGRNVTLTCLVHSRPSSAVWWTYTLKHLRAFNVSTSHVSEDIIKSELVIPSVHVMDRGNYTCIAANFLSNASATIVLNVRAPSKMAPSFSSSSSSFARENPYIEVRIAKQTVYGITLEWYTMTENPGDTWYTLHFGQYDDAKKELIYIAPGVNSYSVNDLLPATKYEVCVALRNQMPQRGQCIVFVTGNDITELEQREKLIHIIIIVCAIVLAVPAGMYACTTDTRLNCTQKCPEVCHKKRKAKTLRGVNKDSVFDSLPTGSDEGLCHHDSSDSKGNLKAFEDKETAGKKKTEHRNIADLY